MGAAYRLKLVVHAPVAQLDRALASGAKGRRFESCRARHSLTRVAAPRQASGTSRLAFGSPRTGTNPAGVHVVPAFGSPRPGTNPAGRLVHVVPRPRSSRTRTNLAGCASPNRSSSQSLVSHSAPLSPAQRLVY